MEGSRVLAFFSYSHIDAESEGALIAEIHAELEKKTRAAWGIRSFDIWRDVNNLRWGATWSKAIDDAIAACDLFVLLLSPGWLRSPFCRQEFEAFKQRERAIGTGERILIAQILGISKALLASDSVAGNSWTSWARASARCGCHWPTAPSSTA
jgi:hypothetical protein